MFSGQIPTIHEQHRGSFFGGQTEVLQCSYISVLDRQVRLQSQNHGRDRLYNPVRELTSDAVLWQ